MHASEVEWERHAQHDKVLPVTSIRDGLEHWVAEEEITGDNVGRYVAVYSHVCLQSGGETVTIWYVASLADGQTHLAEPTPHGLVTAHCDGRRFLPLATLRGTPPDQEQICPACLRLPTTSP